MEQTNRVFLSLAHIDQVCSKTKTYAVCGGGMVKIGRTTSVKKRLTDLQASSPVALRLVAIRLEDIEHEMHFLLNDHRSHGEWFEENESVMATVFSRMQRVDIAAGAMKARSARQPRTQPDEYSKLIADALCGRARWDEVPRRGFGMLLPMACRKETVVGMNQFIRQSRLFRRAQKISGVSTPANTNRPASPVDVMHDEFAARRSSRRPRAFGAQPAANDGARAEQRSDPLSAAKAELARRTALRRAGRL